MLAARSRICKGCWQQLHLPVPLRGIAALPFRVFGIRPSRMNPNMCTVCEMMFTKVMRATKVSVDVSVLFADLRGYTALQNPYRRHRLPRSSTSSMTSAQELIWEYDGLLNKTIGDAIMAIFNFPIRQTDHGRGRSRRGAKYIAAVATSTANWPAPWIAM